MGRKVIFTGFLLMILIFPSYIDALQHREATVPGKMRLEQKKDAMMMKIDGRKEAMMMKREEFKERLQTIRDEVKRKVVERIDTRMGSTNQRVTNRFSAVLDKIQSILNRFVGKAQDAKLAGRDTTDLDSAIGGAQVAIDIASTAVANQTANLYVIEIASESALKSNVGSVVSQLRSDLKEAHKTVIDAKQAVQKVVPEYAKLRGSGLMKKEAATSSSQ